MYEYICMIVGKDNQADILGWNVIQSKYSHFFDPSPLKFPKISRKFKICPLVGFVMVENHLSNNLEENHLK